MTLNPYFLNTTENERVLASKLIEDSRITELPVDVALICRRQGWDLDFLELADTRDAYVEISDYREISIVVNTSNTESNEGFSSSEVVRRRQRFSVAHEIGHAVMKSHDEKSFNCSIRRDGNPHFNLFHNNRESQANRFASELLIPQSHLSIHLKKFKWQFFFQSVKGLCDIFDVSLIACAVRVCKEAPFPALCIFYDTDAKSRQIPGKSRDMNGLDFFIESKSFIPKNTLVDDLANKPDFDGARKRYRNCKTWFPSSKDAERFELEEQSMRIGKYGYITFLSFTERDDDENWSKY